MEKFTYKLQDYNICDVDPGFRRTNIALAKQVGRGGALLANQLVYLLSSRPTFQREGRTWHFITEKELGNQTGYCDRQIRRLIKVLMKAGLIIVSRFNNMKCGRVNCYSLVRTDEPTPTTCDLRYASRLRKMLSRFGRTSLMVTTVAVNSISASDTTGQMSSFLKEERKPYNISSPYIPGYHACQAKTSETGFACHAGGAGEDFFSVKAEGDSKGSASGAQARDATEPIPRDVEHTDQEYVRQRQLKGGVLHMYGQEARPLTTELAQQVLDIYNTTFAEINPQFEPARSVNWFKPEIAAVWRDPLAGDIEVWQAVCSACAASDWMRSKAFTPRLGFMLRPDKLKRIMNSEWGCRYAGPDAAQRVKIMREKAIIAQMEEKIGQTDMTAAEKRARYDLLDTLGHVEYNAWFEGRPWRKQGDQWAIIVDTAFHFDKMSNRFASVLEKLNLTVVKEEKKE